MDCLTALRVSHVLKAKWIEGMGPTITKLLLAFCCFVGFKTVHAAQITWGPATDTTSASQVSNSGALIMAYNPGTSSTAYDVTVNGVPFTSAAVIGPQGFAAGFMSGGTTGDTGFDTLLDLIDAGLASTPLDIGSFVLGHQIEVQIFYTDQRPVGFDRVVRVGSTTSTVTVDLEADPNNAITAPYGQFLTGTFIADGNDPDITLEYLGSPYAYISALQVRDLSVSPSAYLGSLVALKEHITGVAPLTAAEIASHKLYIESYPQYPDYSSAIVDACFDLVEAYDNTIGPLWVAGSPKSGGFTRSTVTDDIHWTIYNVMQLIMDEIYTEDNLSSYESVLNGFLFGSSSSFPGSVSPPVDPNVTHTVTIDGSYLDAFGRQTQHGDRPARKPTGTYLAPGSIATITVPSSIVGQGYQVRVGAHGWDLSNKDIVKRLDRSSLLYDIDSTEIKVASPLGGGIYIEVPLLADAGAIDVQIKNAVRSPFFSATSVNTTTLTEWQNTERNHPAPWADFQSETCMFQVPTSWIYAFDDPVTMMADWDLAVQICDDLMGFPFGRDKETYYTQVDVERRVGPYNPGYPSVNITYSPNFDYGGNYNHYFLTGPQNIPWYDLHELGHSYIPGSYLFSGEAESAVNLLHVAAWHQGFGYDLDTAFEESMNYNIVFRTLDTTAIAWMMCQNFKFNQPMVEQEKKYQLKGHAKFVEIARLLGWEVINDYWKSFNDDYENGITSATDTDSLILRLSQSAGYDLRPLLHFWGIHPVDASALSASIAASNLPPSAGIHDMLLKYKSFVPANNAEYQTFALNWWGGVQPSLTGFLTESEHASIWSTYDEAYAASIENNVQSLIDLYFPGWSIPEATVANSILPYDIALDGLINEWWWMPGYPTDPDDMVGLSDASNISGAGNQANWNSIKLAYMPDAEQLYFAYENQTDIYISWGFQIFIDTDLDKTTGYNSDFAGINLPVGAEYLIEGVNIWEYTGTGTDWSWTLASPWELGRIWSGKVGETFLPLSWIGNPTSFDFFCFGNNVFYTGVDEYDFYPDNAASGGFFRFIME